MVRFYIFLQMKINVLGLGTSVSRYNGSGISIGVNDVWRYYPTDYLVVVDRPDSFNNEPERLKVIKESKPILFFSHLPEWRFMNGYVEMKLANHRGDLSEIKTKYPYSISSPYCAVAIAYKLGAKEIDIYGVDMNNHHAIKNEIRDKEIERFKELFRLIQKDGVKIRVTQESSLSKIIPCF